MPTTGRLFQTIVYVCGEATPPDNACIHYSTNQGCRSLTRNIDGMFVSSSLMHTICHSPSQRKPDSAWYSTKVLPRGPSKYLMSHNTNLHIHHRWSS